MIKTIIVDDDQNSLDDLQGMLEIYNKELKIVAVCRNIKEAETAINYFHPELVFLDVELGSNHLSFDLLKKIVPVYFEIIFITAHNKYALQAIKSSAIDYLLKPIDAKELKVAIEKFKNRTSKVDMHRVESLLAAWGSPGNQQNKISLPTMYGYDLITIADIVSCEGFNNQTSMILKEGKELLISRPLKEYEEILTPYHFFRIHKSYLINLNHVKKFTKGKDGTVTMVNDKSFPVSRNFKDQFVERIRNPHSF